MIKVDNVELKNNRMVFSFSGAAEDGKYDAGQEFINLHKHYQELSRSAKDNKNGVLLEERIAKLEDKINECKSKPDVVLEKPNVVKKIKKKRIDIEKLISSKYYLVSAYEMGYIVRDLAKRKCGFYDLEGYEILPCEFCNLEKEKNGIIAYKEYKIEEGLCVAGYYDYNGREILPCEFSRLDEERNGIIAYKERYDKREGRVYLGGYYDYNGREVLPCEFDYLYEEKNGIIVCKKYYYENRDYKGLEGYYDYNGQEILPCEFENIKEGENGIIAYKDKSNENELSGYYSYEGEEIIPLGKWRINFYHDGLIIETFKDKQLIGYDNYGYFNSGYVYKEVKCVFCDYDGNVIVKCNCKNEFELKRKIEALNNKWVVNGNSFNAKILKKIKRR